MAASVFILLTQLSFRWPFLILYDYWETLLFTKVYRYTEMFFNRHVVVSFATSVLKRSPCFILSRQHQYNTNTKNLSCSKMLSCFILIKLFLTNFVCYFLFLHCFFYIALSDFFEFLTTSKLLWKHIFYIISLILKLEKKITE